MHFDPANPLIVQSDQTLMLETMGERFAPARDALARFAELVKSPEYVHTYRITPLSLWNAAAAGLSVEDVVDSLERWAKTWSRPTSPNPSARRWRGMGVSCCADGDALILEADEDTLMAEVRALKGARPFLGRRLDARRSRIATAHRGELKQALIGHGLPVRDLAGFGTAGDWMSRSPGPSRWRVLDPPDLPGTGRRRLPGRTCWERRGRERRRRPALRRGQDHRGPHRPRTPRHEDAHPLHEHHRTPPMAGRDHRADLLTEDEVGEYSGATKDVLPVTLTTYQMLTWRPSRDHDFVHFGLFDEEDWGLVIYDEVHLLPAPVFRTVAHIQARRRLGLTATLVREDGQEGDVFALIGPKRFDMPWKDLEHQGWIASATCTEIGSHCRRTCGCPTQRRPIEKFESLPPVRPRSPSQNHSSPATRRAESCHRMYRPVGCARHDMGCTLITGRTRQSERDRLFAAFRDGGIRVLVISRVGNFSVDLPDADVLIQVSGTWGSRQEEAQRLGRVLRPKRGANQAWFYTLVSRDTVEQDFGEKRQLFLAEQGYGYSIEVVE